MAAAGGDTVGGAYELTVVTGRGPMDRMEGARVAVDGLRELGVVPVRSGP